VSPKKGTVNQRRRAVIHRYSNGKTQTNFSEPKKLNYSENNMEISTFELLAKPIAPVAGTVLSTVGRKIVQGYFLTISNLESFPVDYRIEFTIRKPNNNPAGLNRILRSNNLPNAIVNAVIFLDSVNDNQPITLIKDPDQGQTERYRANFTIAGRNTASFQLLPNLPDVLTIPRLLEVRGFVSLFRRRPNAAAVAPVRVLLNPEIRGTFLPRNFPPPANPPLPSDADSKFDFDQINYTLAIASGKGLNVIPAGPAETVVGGPGNLASPIFQPLLEEFNNGTLDLATLEAENPEKAKMLVQLLAELDASEVNLSELNTVMERLEIPVRMSSI
jgi:hypothetical protein